MIADAALPEEGTFVDAEWPVGERFTTDGKKTPIMARKITALPDWYKQGEPKPAGGRVTFTPWTFYSKDEPLLDSGLLGPRSEEHTSELQSLMRISSAVFCFKKKKNST